MRAFIYLHFPERRTFSPERGIRSLTDGLPVYAEVRYPSVAADAFAETHEPLQVEFRAVLLPQSAMIQAMQTGSVRAVWSDVVWRISECTQEDDNTLTLTAEREKAYVAPDYDDVTIGADTVEIGKQDEELTPDTAVLRD